MIDGIILVAITIPAIIGVFSLMLNVINGPGGTKGISTQPYYGRKTGKKYTAEKTREHHIV
jgi:hypothetical protein